MGTVTKAKGRNVVCKELFNSTAEIVAARYRPSMGVGGKLVPWQPYNFHAGNFFDEATGYSPQDQTTAELLKAKCVPMPNWVFSAKFPLQALEKWTGRQIDLFSQAGLTLHQVRVKNPGPHLGTRKTRVGIRIVLGVPFWRCLGPILCIVFAVSGDVRTLFWCGRYVRF